MFTVVTNLILFLARSRRGRRLLLLGVLGTFRLLQNPTARRAYAGAWRTVTDPRPRRASVTAVRSAAGRVRDVRRPR